MKTFSFRAVPDKNGQIALPAEVTSALPRARAVEVLLVLREEGDSEEAEEDAWRRLALESFFEGYADSDAIYDEV